MKVKKEETLPDYSYPPFEAGKIYKNRNFGKFRVTEITENMFKYEILDNPGCIIEDKLCEIFERICHNTYYEEWRKINSIPVSLNDCH